MGCGQSSSIDKKAGGGGRVGGPSAPMSKQEIGKRIDSIEQTCAATFGGVTVRYAYLSQRGYYPDDTHKPNQDSYVVKHDFANKPSDAFFGVFDGHGRDGDKCAQFVRDNLPTLLAKGMTKARDAKNKNSPSHLTLDLTKERTQDILSRAHTECNRKMHVSPGLDDSLSGTTSISVYLHGERNRITVANVGDSRAVIGRMADAGHGNNNYKEGISSSISSNHPSSTLKAFALSRDQTPYRRDERIRIRKTGARILSLDQIEGLEPIDPDEAKRDEEAQMNGGSDGEIVLGEEIDEGGDPPRVWSPDGDYPGTAFTRSIGDAIAEQLGVTAVPEMLTRKITPEDKIIVLASDGVFEFLTNQSVIDICAKFSDPLEACRAVVAESYELWLQYELRTDDITMICIFVDGVDTANALKSSINAVDIDPKELLKLGSGESFQEESDALITNSTRPTRKNMSLEKSRALQKMKAKSIQDVTAESEEDFDIESLYNDKTDEEKARIREAIRASVVFQNITDVQRELIYKVMEPMPVKKGQWIIKQGTVGDRFYIVDEGSFEVRILAENQQDTDGRGGNRVHVYEGSRANHSHPSFGELALMYSAPRAASIIAQTDGQLWALHRYAFKKITAEQGARRDVEKILRKIDVFKSFTSEELKDLASYLCETKYGRGDTIIKEGEPGDSLFIILPGGSCKSVRTADDGSETTTKLKENDFFGEEILKAGGKKNYLSTVTATNKCSCFMLQKSDVKRVIGSKRKANTNTVA